MNDNRPSLLPAEPQTIVREAVSLKASGSHNCAQAVACAFAPAIGADKDMVYQIGNAFGNGMGCMEATCGSLTGAGIILGIVTGDRIKAMKAMAANKKKFHTRNGATICRKLKGIEIDPETGKMTVGTPLRACNHCVADSSELLAETLATLLP